MKRLREDLVLGDRYELVARIAVGGMGEVWQAVDSVLERTVAVKIMKPSIDEEESFAERFRDEARHMAGLSSHPHIATVFDYGEHDELAYLVMELVRGETLGERLRRDGRLPADEVRSIVAQAALALGFAHDAGVVHRDVKPANVMVEPAGVVKLTDFGIARAMDGSGHTRTGEVLGTPYYLSPEQALGRPATGASDLYALGVVAHEMLVGQRPFDRGTPVATALSHINEPPPRLPGDVPADLAAVITRCLAKDPADRPARADEVAAALGLDLNASSGAIVVPVNTPTTGPAALESAADPASGPLAAAAGAPLPDLAPTPPASFGDDADTLDWIPEWRGTPERPLTELDDLLAHLSPSVHDGEYAIVGVPAHPEGLSAYMSITEAEGLTLLVAAHDARAAGLDFDAPLTWITLEVYRAVDALGFVAAVTTALTQAQIPAVAMAGRHHTHLLVPVDESERAMKVLRRLSMAQQVD